MFACTLPFSPWPRRPTTLDCEERKTLLQWSYGTSFEGGPDLSEPLVTDRPDFTEASVTVGRGVTQLECGYTFIHDDDNGVRTNNHSFPETLLRVGTLAEWFELRFDWNYAAQQTDIGGVSDNQTGAEDLYARRQARAYAAGMPVAGDRHHSANVACRPGPMRFRPTRVLPGVNYLYGWDLNEDWSLGGSTGLNSATDDETTDTYSEFSQSMTMGHSWTRTGW